MVPEKAFWGRFWSFTTQTTFFLLPVPFRLRALASRWAVTGLCLEYSARSLYAGHRLPPVAQSALLPLGGFGLLFISTNSTDPSLLWPPSSPSERCSPSLLCACTRNAPCTHDQRFQQPLQPTNSHVICRESFIDEIISQPCSVCVRALSHI